MAVIVHTLYPIDQKYNSITLHACLWHRALESHVSPESSLGWEGKQQVGANREVVLYHYGSFAWKAFGLARRGRCVFVFHNVTPARVFWKWNPLTACRSLAAELQLRLLPKSLPWIAVSEFNLQTLRHSGFYRAEVVPLIVEPTHSGQKSEKPTLLFVGRLSPSKNVIELLRMYRRVCRKARTEPRLVIVGPRKRRCRYADAFESELESFRSTGSVDWVREFIRYEDLRALHKQAWLYVSMSRHEGFGVPVCEAIAAGTPSLYLECGGTESVLKGVGCVPRNAPDSFAERVVELLSDEDARMKLHAEQAEALGNLKADIVAKQLLEAVKTLSSPGHGVKSRTSRSQGAAEGIFAPESMRSE